PYDENHIIGIGKDTVEPQEEYSWTRDFAWYQGLKIALFDVSDFDNPKEVAKIIIGDRGTDSPVLYDHKAFLFDREKELLVLPVSLYEIADEIKEQNDGYTGNTYGQFKTQGAFVYRLSLENGFEFRGTITHMDEDDYSDETYYWRWNSPSYVSRSLYIEDVLYTISDNMVKMNSLDDLSEIDHIELV
ncbi:MAG: beta-propeller domain-containing protein, partial [Thermoplasmatales archaeon]